MQIWNLIDKKTKKRIDTEYSNSYEDVLKLFYNKYKNFKKDKTVAVLTIEEFKEKYEVILYA